MYTQWMVIKGMVFVLVTLSHLSNSMSKSTSTSLLDTSLNGDMGGKKGDRRIGGIVLQEDEENFFTEESFTPLNQIRMNEEQASPRNVTAQIGHPVYLHCIVEPIGDKMVSWIRLKDFTLLTVGLLIYTPDDRFVIRHGTHTLSANDWALQIKHVTLEDEGIYECQVNTDPPRSQYYRLNVVVPVTAMVGSPDMFVRAGSLINLTCIILNTPTAPSHVFWYHNERMINYDFESVPSKGSINLIKNPNEADSVISRLTIKSAKYNDSGNYSCQFLSGSSTSDQAPASIYVHVLQGERRQSDIQNDEESSDSSSSSSSTTMITPYYTSPSSILRVLSSSNVNTVTIQYFYLLILVFNILNPVLFAAAPGFLLPILL